MSSRLRGRRIAIAVTDEALRETLRRTLQREGALISVSATGESLLISAQAFNPHACILDVDLPDHGPEDLLARVRGIRGDLPVILVSAHLLPGDVPALRDLPILPLPFSRVQLVDLLERAVAGQAA